MDSVMIFLAFTLVPAVLVIGIVYGSRDEEKRRRAEVLEGAVDLAFRRVWHQLVVLPGELSVGYVVAVTVDEVAHDLWFDGETWLDRDDITDGVINEIYQRTGYSLVVSGEAYETDDSILIEELRKRTV